MVPQGGAAGGAAGGASYNSVGVSANASNIGYAQGGQGAGEPTICGPMKALANFAATNKDCKDSVAKVRMIRPSNKRSMI